VAIGRRSRFAGAKDAPNVPPAPVPLRSVGVAVDTFRALLIADTAGNTIWRVTPAR